MLHPKKVGTLPVKGSDEEKQTNEIKIAAPMLDAIEIEDRTVTADAVLTQCDLAQYLVEERGANYHFTVNREPIRIARGYRLLFSEQPKRG
ncbi:MAG: hypothetical protein KZQ61_17355 [Candidatus Thiodiazotropha sp. (ex Lucinoma aequizonata)]|nr:hypothetical protein [Candidatus Thiodiazotropha sp. (ex Lucinoma aequizonata)]MCU7900127.1 hypothetical protein [Candidatus Thiodiazotropha sp. (ex Lucinoma aequizonata)]